MQPAFNSEKVSSSVEEIKRRCSKYKRLRLCVYALETFANFGSRPIVASFVLQVPCFIFSAKKEFFPWMNVGNKWFRDPRPKTPCACEVQHIQMNSALSQQRHSYVSNLIVNCSVDGGSAYIWPFFFPDIQWLYGAFFVKLCSISFVVIYLVGY